MSWTSEELSQWRRYLLGELSDADQREITRLRASDQRITDGLNLAESNLVDEYAAGELSPQERDLFEKHYLTDSSRKAKVDFARRFLDLSARDRTMRKVRRVLAGLVLAALVMLVGFLLADRKSSSSEIAFIAAMPNTRDSKPSELSLKQLIGPVVALQIPVDGVCSASELALDVREIGTSTAAVQLRLRAGSAGRREFLTHLPKEALSPGDYLVTLECGGGAERHEYVFRLVP